MSATGLDVFDKTLQATHTWLDQISTQIGPDRQLAWRVLGAVLRALRDRLPIGLAAHLGAQLPLLVRGLYYDQWRPSEEPRQMRSRDEFLAQGGGRPLRYPAGERRKGDSRRVCGARPLRRPRPDQEGAGCPAARDSRAVAGDRPRRPRRALGRLKRVQPRD